MNAPPKKMALVKAGMLDCVGGEAQPDGAHEEGEAEVHADAQAVGDDVAVGFDEGAVDEGEGYA